MTDTSKPVIRRTRLDTIFEKGKHRRIVARLGEGDDVSFRLEGMKDWSDPLELKALCWRAIHLTANRKWSERNAKRKELGLRALKKPKFSHV